MKVGDLVQLSAAGKKTGSNWTMRGEMGIILTVNHGYENPFQIHWFNGPKRKSRSKWWMKRYELKKLRVKNGSR